MSAPMLTADEAAYVEAEYLRVCELADQAASAATDGESHDLFAAAADRADALARWLHEVPSLAKERERNARLDRDAAVARDRIDRESFVAQLRERTAADVELEVRAMAGRLPRGERTYPFDEDDRRSAMALAIARTNVGDFGVGESFAQLLARSALEIAEAKAQLGFNSTDAPRMNRLVEDTLTRWEAEMGSPSVPSARLRGVGEATALGFNADPTTGRFVADERRLLQATALAKARIHTCTNLEATFADEVARAATDIASALEQLGVSPLPSAGFRGTE